MRKNRSEATPLQSTRWCRWCDDEPGPDRVPRHPNGVKHPTEFFPRAWHKTPRDPAIMRARVALEQLVARLNKWEADMRKVWGNRPVPLTYKDGLPTPGAKPDPRVRNAYVALRWLQDLKSELRNGDPYSALMLLADFAYQATAADVSVRATKSGKRRAEQRRSEAERHRQQAAEINERRNLTRRALAKLIAKRCNKEKRPCRARTIERHLS